MRYWVWPPAGSGSHSYYWDGDQSCGGNFGGGNLSADFSDPYDWANMPDDCNSGCSPNEENALAELSYEVGVAFEMDYGSCSSGAFTDDALTVFPTYFGYSYLIDRENRSEHTVGTWFDLTKAQVDMGRPMLYTIVRHAIVCDSWRDTGGQNQYHMNYGWGGASTGWYTIDSLFCPWPGCDPMEEYLIRDIIGFTLCGSLSGTLDPGVYHVRCDISVDYGDSLVILPGTTLDFDGPYSFTINGTLLAEGTESDSIIFTTAQVGSNRWSGLRFHPGSSGSRLTYCLIENGLAPGPDYRGGGVFSTGSSPTFTHCTIRDNTAQYGGGVYGAGIFTQCTISGNSADYGGGVNEGGTFTQCIISDNGAQYGGGVKEAQAFSYCTFSTNSADYGGGVYFSSTSPSFENCTFSGNSALLNGGGAFCSGAGPPPATFDSCTFTGNSAVSGGGAYCSRDNTLIFTHCSFSSDSAGYGGGVYCFEGSSPIFTSCSLDNNLAGDGGGVYCDRWSSPAFTLCSICNGSASKGGGVYCDYGSFPTFRNCTISSNSTWGYPRSAGGGYMASDLRRSLRTAP